MKRLLFTLTALGGLLSSAQAAFLTGFSAWTTTGDTGLVDNVAFTTNAVALGTDDASNQNISGVDPVFDLEEFVGLSPGGFSNAGFDVSEGSALKQSFSLSVGETFSFSWEYLTNDLFEDFAFLVLDGDLMSLADFSTAVAGGSYGFSHALAGMYISAPALVDGTVTLALGVADTGDFSTSSALRVPSITVPESGAGTFGLALTMVLLGLVRRRLGRAIV
jgi:hypothetical protein